MYNQVNYNVLLYSWSPWDCKILIEIQDSPKTHPRYTQDTPKTHPRHIQDSPKTHPRHTQESNMSTILAIKIPAGTDWHEDAW